jgi:hypothetical protein
VTFKFFPSIYNFIKEELASKALLAQLTIQAIVIHGTFITAEIQRTQSAIMRCHKNKVATCRRFTLNISAKIDFRNISQK